MLVFSSSITYFSIMPVSAQYDSSHIELVGCFDQYGNPQLPCDFSNQGPPPQQQQPQQQQPIPSGFFDFYIDVYPQLRSIRQGDTASATVTVMQTSGTTQDVHLTVTKYYNMGIVSVFNIDTVPPNAPTTLSIHTDCSTPPDNYLFTVQGETQGTFRTHVQTLNVHVTANAACGQSSQNIPSTQPQNNPYTQTPSGVSTGSPHILNPIDGKSYDVAYAAVGATVTGLSMTKSNSLVINLQAISNGHVEVNLQRALIDAKAGDQDNKFIVLVDGANANFVELGTYSTYRILSITFSQGTQAIEIIGTQSQGQTPSSTTPNGGRCLIATAAFGSEVAPQVQFLRGFRDNHILATQSGSSFMNVFNAWYYSFSPYVADYERQQPWLQQIVKTSIYPLLGILTLSEKGFSAVPGDYGAIVAGSIASSMIGAVYFWPFALSIKQVRKNRFNYKFAVLLIAVVAISVVGSILSQNKYALMITTSLFVLTLLSVSAIFVAKLITKIRLEFSKKHIKT